MSRVADETPGPCRDCRAPRASSCAGSARRGAPRHRLPRVGVPDDLRERDLYQQGIRSRALRGGLLRLAIVLLLAAGLPPLERLLRRRRGRPALLGSAVFLRTMLPFLMCIAVYTNLHDTVRYVNRHDVHAHLAAVEEWIFGGQPVLWAERYITPWRTDFFNFFYANFYLVAPSVFLVLWFSGRREDARVALLGVILCFYSGYVLYVLLPAAPPRLYFASLGLFTKSLAGGPDHALPGSAHRDDAEPRGARRLSKPPRRRELFESRLRVEVRPVVRSDPAGVRRGPAGGDGLPAPSLGRRSAGGSGARAVGTVDHAAVRTVLVDARGGSRIRLKPDPTVLGLAGSTIPVEAARKSGIQESG